MYVVDGYNLAHRLKHAGVLGPGAFGEQRRAMLALLAVLARREDRQVRVFLDGTPTRVSGLELAQPGVRVTFCGPQKESADHAIREFVAARPEPRKVTVVTDDREVAQACRLAGARLESSRHLAARLGRLSAREPTRGDKPQAKPRAGNRNAAMESQMLSEIGDWSKFQHQALRGEDE
jgi:predicted RNA-binding protein with PIN domain